MLIARWWWGVGVGAVSYTRRGVEWDDRAVLTYGQAKSSEMRLGSSWLLRLERVGLMRGLGL